MAGLGFTTIAIAVFFANVEPHWMKWLIWLVTLSGLMVITFWRAPEEPTRDEDDLIEVARQAISSSRNICLICNDHINFIVICKFNKISSF